MIEPKVRATLKSLQGTRALDAAAVRWPARRSWARAVEEEKPSASSPPCDDAARHHDVESERSFDAFAARDAHADNPTSTDESTPREPRWITPLIGFLGHEEPSDDDRDDWVIRDAIPRGEPSLLAGPPKSGKTWMAADLLLSIASGTTWLGSFENTMIEPARAFGVLLEDSERRLRKRIWQLARGRGIDPRLLQDTLSITRKPFGMPDRKDMAALTGELKLWKPAVVIVDNLTRTMAGDPNATKEAAAFGRAWMKLCQDSGAAICFLHHTAKAGTDDRRKRSPADRVRGSGDFVATARNVMVIDPLEIENGEKRSIVDVFGNLDLRRESFVIGYESSDGADGRRSVRLVDCGDACDVKAEMREQRKARRSEVKESTGAARERAALYEALTVGKVTADALVKAGVGSQGTASKVLTTLRERGHLARSAAGHVLTPAGSEALRSGGVQ